MRWSLAPLLVLLLPLGPALATDKVAPPSGQPKTTQAHRCDEMVSNPPRAPDPVVLRRLDSQTVDAHLGVVVAVEGIYTPVTVRMRPPGAKHEDPKAPKPRTVSIEGKGGSVMLEVYYMPMGVRSEEEIARFKGKRVRVIGLLERTPLLVHDGIPMATMTGPCLRDIQSITLVSP